MNKITPFSKSFLTFVIIIASIFTISNSYSDSNNEKPQKHDADKKIEKKVILYTKESCIYCKLAKKLLREKYISYESTDLDNNPKLANNLMNRTGQRTVPFVFIGDKFIGGYTELKKLVDEKKI